MKKDSIGNRMKDNYESRSRYKLIRRMPVIIRLDGKAFHTLTRNCDKPFDEDLSMIMKDGMKFLLENIQGAKIGYKQSDEISILLTDYDTLMTDAWFDNNIQKICSVSASMISAHINSEWDFDFKTEDEFGKIGLGWKFNSNKLWLFDSRCFNIPKEEVNNYFVWRQQDWIRNSLQMLARSYYSHKQLHNKNSADIHEMLYNKGVNWADLEGKWKNGVIMYKTNEGFVENNKIIFTQDDIVNKFL